MTDGLLFWLIPIFLLGICVGSFLNVVIDRLPQGLSLGGRSHCDNCQKQLTWKELIPVFSFLLLGGRCLRCQNKLKWQYPVVELTCGLLFILVFLKQGLGLISLSSFSIVTLLLTLIFHLFLVSSLLALAIIDWKQSLLPDEINLPVILITLFVLVNLVFLGQLTLSSFLLTLGTAALAGLFFSGIVFFTSGKGMGDGDIRIAFLMGLVLGWPKTLIAFYLSFFLASIAALFLIAYGKKRFGQTIALGPFLVFGTFALMFWGEQIQGFWLKIFGF